MNQLDTILRIKGVQEALGLSKATIWSMVAEGELPPPLRLRKGGRAVGWKASVIKEYINALEPVSASELDSAE